MRDMPNPRAEQIFQASGLPDTDKVRRAIKADARYMMNHLNVRFSDAVESACQNYPNLASPIALSILNAED